MPPTQHTPGPWRIDPASEYDLAVIRDNDDGEGIAELGPHRTPENLANARLIAAAPDLLTALEGCIAYLADRFDGYPVSTASIAARPCMDAARAAILKAKGE